MFFARRRSFSCIMLADVIRASLLRFVPCLKLPRTGCILRLSKSLGWGALGFLIIITTARMTIIIPGIHRPCLPCGHHDHRKNLHRFHLRDQHHHHRHHLHHQQHRQLRCSCSGQSIGFLLVVVIMCWVFSHAFLRLGTITNTDPAREAGPRVGRYSFFWVQVPL